MQILIDAKRTEWIIDTENDVYPGPVKFMKGMTLEEIEASCKVHNWSCTVISPDAKRAEEWQYDYGC